MAIAALLSCSKEDAVSEPWHIINLSAAVGTQTVATATGQKTFWKTTVTLDKTVYDSSFVVVQWDVYAAPGSSLATIKDTIPIAPMQSGTVSHISWVEYQQPWFTDQVKIVWAWSGIWNKYEFRY